MYTKINYITPEEAVKCVHSGDHIHFSSVASSPRVLIDALCKRGDAGELRDVKIHHLHTAGEAKYTDPKYEGIFFHQAFFVGGNVRQSVQAGYADYIPVFLNETQKLYRTGILPCDVAMIQVSPPDKHGYVSLGTSVDATLAAIECAREVIAVVNKYVPRAFGDALIPASLIHHFVQHDEPLMPAHFSEPNPIEIQIGKNCASLIEDGATLQMGIGAIPNAVLAQLRYHKNLGIHTEMFADGVLPLVERGVINGSCKVTDKGKIVSTFLMGSQNVYDFSTSCPVLTAGVLFTIIKMKCYGWKGADRRAPHHHTPAGPQAIRGAVGCLPRSDPRSHPSHGGGPACRCLLPHPGSRGLAGRQRQLPVPRPCRILQRHLFTTQSLPRRIVLGGCLRRGQLRSVCPTSLFRKTEAVRPHEGDFSGPEFYRPAHIDDAPLRRRGRRGQ